MNLQPAFFRFTLATTTALIFREPVSDLGNDNHETFDQSFNYASYISTICLWLTDFYQLYSPKGYTVSCNTVKQYTDHFIDKALNQKAQKSESQALILDLYEDLNLVRD